MVLTLSLALEGVVFSLLVAAAFAFYLIRARQRPIIQKIYDNPKVKYQ
jgi:hypothetical protein